ncbi:hypothetical protein DICSQDRAFT_127802 [Dichomitus squalens LYAD-421 SS1]|uniref:Uncharacterized protein n=1 Tax=Dichomitus squalens (strain LYAD-421) TaxID=732165 RepID=R7SVU0_DICSQ|nr:uncharacterized protein DICSQDRAFT_127802 [Dichomitus squalens LYAD-421 SS1]EJF60309.1 hypothetical protein DICSQDRAFT_127802 [Dichomitus squalens LYAD-421 SS1]
MAIQSLCFLIPVAIVLFRACMVPQSQSLSLELCRKEYGPPLLAHMGLSDDPELSNGMYHMGTEILASSDHNDSIRPAEMNVPKARIAVCILAMRIIYMIKTSAAVGMQSLEMSWKCGGDAATLVFGDTSLNFETWTT